MDDFVGHNLGPYRIVEQIGAGGMATVYKAFEPAMNRYVAIKLMPAHLARDPNFRARFHREASIITMLEHPYILPIHAKSPEDEPIPYLVMRYTDGGTLADLIASGSLTIERAVRLVGQVAQALAYAHRQAIAHRDIKPSNILIGRDGSALVSDFGIAKIMEDTFQFSGTGVAVGTPAYMSPEQAQGQKVDGRTDIYALGVVLYEAVTGVAPFSAETPLAVLLMHVNSPLRPPRQLNPAIPEALEQVILRAMAKDPADRFQTADQMAGALVEASAPPTVVASIKPAQMNTAAATASVAQTAPIAETAPASEGVVARRPSRAWLAAGASLIALLLVVLLRGVVWPAPAAACSPTIMYGQTITCSATPSKIDMYTLTAKAHERAAIKLLNTSGKELLKMEVWDARHDRVCNYLWNVPPAGDPGCLFPRDGAYTIEIAPYDQAATDPIAYAVTVLRLDDPSTARPIAPAQPQTGSLERGIAIHTYTLDAKADERVAIKVLNTSGKELLATTVWDAKHNRVCGYLGSAPAAGDPGCLLPSAGTYTIEIESDDQTAAGPIAYAVTVLRLDDPSAARPIAPAQPQTGSLESGIAIHAYTLDARDNEQVSIKVLNTSGKELLATTVWNAKHERVCGYLGSAPASSDPACLLPSAGIYTIEIESSDQTVAGPIAYTLSLDDMK